MTYEYKGYRISINCNPVTYLLQNIEITKDGVVYDRYSTNSPPVISEVQILVEAKTKIDEFKNLRK